MSTTHALKGRHHTAATSDRQTSKTSGSERNSRPQIKPGVLIAPDIIA